MSDFRVEKLAKPASLAGFQITAELRQVALNFIRLREARHKADYDLATGWTRVSTQQQVALAEGVFAAWAQVKGTEEANIFLLSLLLWKNFEKEY